MKAEQCELYTGKGRCGYGNLNARCIYSSEEDNNQICKEPRKERLPVPYPDQDASKCEMRRIALKLMNRKPKLELVGVV